MKQYLFYIVKYFKWVYTLYFYLGNFIIRILKVFIKPDDRLILFVSFGGRKYDDSPKAIYLQMINDKRFEDYRFVWAFINPKQFQIPVGDKIKTDTLKYFITALKARVWVTNSAVERGLSFKGVNTFYLNTWHGTPIKKIGSDIPSESKGFAAKGKNNYDVFLSQSNYEAHIFSHAFGIPMDNIKIIGLPRNDIFSSIDNKQIISLKIKLGIPIDKKVILYAPTYREYDSPKGRGRVLTLPFNVEKWKRSLGEKFTLIFRAHYEVSQSLNIVNDDFVKDMSKYHSLDELMLVSDLLISDYSSIFFDYSIMHKPMLCYAYDYDRYVSERGVYFDIREYLPTTQSEEELIELIQNTDITQKTTITQIFQEKFVTEYGMAAKASVDIIYKGINVK